MCGSGWGCAEVRPREHIPKSGPPSAHAAVENSASDLASAEAAGLAWRQVAIVVLCCRADQGCFDKRRAPGLRRASFSLVPLLNWQFHFGHELGDWI